jgi:protein involved in polysaccharide export with SLBB domain
MSKMLKLGRNISIESLLLVWWLACAGSALGQETNQAVSPSFDPSLSGSPGQAGSLSAERIILVLRDDSELLLQVKNLVIQDAYEHGTVLDLQDLTDETLFQQIRQNAHIRALATREIENSRNLGPNPTGDESTQDQMLPEQDLKEQSASDGIERGPHGSLPAVRPRPLEQRPKEPIRTDRDQRRESSTGEDQNRPATNQRANPYPNLPSLQDLYRQIPSGDVALRRFGADIFQNGTGNSDNLPMDLPAGPDYVLGPGDGLNINMWGKVSQKITVVVDRGGRITLPESGTVVVAGHTLSDAEQIIQKALSTQFKNVRIDVSLTRLRTLRVYVVGDVERPGAYDISSLSTPLNALYAAGGPSGRGSLRTVRHYRGKQLVREVDLYDLMLNGIRSDVERMEQGDTILVPPVGPQVTVAGMVRRPAIYELRNEKELSDVLELAGGVLVSATLRQISVERIEAHQRRTQLSLSLPETDDKDGLKKALGLFPIQDGDRVTISPIRPYSEETVYLQGHVFRPGKYSYHPGIQITELLRSYQDLLPEPAQHAEIVRLVPPDYRPTVIDFKLGDVLEGDDPITLQPFDTIRVFGRYEIDPPKVSIYGEVLRPGKYPLAEDMTATALVRMAGGFKRSAFTQEADITSYVVSNGDKVLTKHETVQMAKAISGDHTADTVLKPNDVLTVRQLAGWGDIGASVTVNGEVLYPGTYGIEEGETLSTLLLRAGGFRSNAYPEGAVLERVQVRELAERSRTELIRRIETAGANPRLSFSGSAQDQAGTMQVMAQQQQQALSALRDQPASGRLVVNISGDIRSWQNTQNDIELRSGDVLTIPKKPSFVLVSGEVYNASALTYTPGKNAGWYLRQAGGETDLANEKAIYIIRANGSVVGRGDSGSWWKGNVRDATMRRGDTIVVPEKIIGGSHVWKNVLDTAQLTSSLAIAARVATSF